MIYKNYVQIARQAKFMLYNSLATNCVSSQLRPA